MLLWIHPIVQGLTALLAIYVLALGLSRFAARHLGMNTKFQWNRHVAMGKIVVIVWAAGALGGLAVTYLTYGKVFTESLHFRIGLLILPVLLVTWITGTRMDRNRNQSNVLPVIHLANNVLLLILAGFQAVTGLGIVQNALLK
ncbi:MAG: DUF4079 family protein [Desulfobacterales bacterium]